MFSNADFSLCVFEFHASDNSFFTASKHSTAACCDSGARPPTHSSIIAGVNDASSARVLFCIHSVSADPLAIEAVQPRTLYRTSAIRSSWKRADRRRMSPQAGFEISTVTAGGSSSPTLRGFLK